MLSGAGSFNSEIEIADHVITYLAKAQHYDIADFGLPSAINNQESTCIMRITRSWNWTKTHIITW